MNSVHETASRAAARAQHSAGRVADGVRSNPVPVAALTAAGLAWWFSRDNGRASNVAREDTARRPGRLRSAMGDHPFELALVAGSVGYFLSEWQKRPAGDALMRVSEVARRSRLGDAVSSVAGEAREPVESALEATGGFAARTAHRLKADARHLADDVQQRWRESGPAVERWIHDNPLAVGAAAMAVGVAVGLSAPSTRAEDRALGPARDTLAEKATGVAHDIRVKAGERARSIAHQAADLARSAMP